MYTRLCVLSARFGPRAGASTCFYIVDAQLCTAKLTENSPGENSDETRETTGLPLQRHAYRQNASLLCRSLQTKTGMWQTADVLCAALPLAEALSSSYLRFSDLCRHHLQFAWTLLQKPSGVNSVRTRKLTNLCCKLSPQFALQCVHWEPYLVWPHVTKHSSQRLLSPIRSVPGLRRHNAVNARFWNLLWQADRYTFVTELMLAMSAG